MQNDKLNCPFCSCGAIYEITESEDIVEKVPALFCNGCKMIFKVENDSPYLNDDKTFEYLKEKLHKQFNTRKSMERITGEINLLERKQKKIMRETDINSEMFETVRIDEYVKLDEVLDIVKGGVDNAEE